MSPTTLGTLCPHAGCGALERIDWQSVREVGHRVRLACPMGHDRWVDLAATALSPLRDRDARAGLQGRVEGRFPAVACERCGLPIDNRLAWNQKRHGACADAEHLQRRRAKRTQTA